MLQSLFSLLALVATVSSQVIFTPRCSHPFDWIRDPQDCTHFWRCVWGRAVEMPRCPSRLVLSTKLNVCVFPGSIWDDCPRTARPRPNLTTTRRPIITTPYPTARPTVPQNVAPTDRCVRGETVFPHPRHCQLYYNCTNLYRTIPRYFEQHLSECPYPQLFDTRSLTCRHFKEVDCGDRVVAIDACDYRSFWCPVSHCIPCNVDNPSCANLQDGLNVFPGREWSPSFIECQQGRTVNVGECLRDVNYQVPQYFNPETRMCVNAFRVPRERGGLMPTCDGRFDGAYPVPENIPGVSFICQTGRLLNIRYCPEGSTGRVEPRTCIYS